MLLSAGQFTKLEVIDNRPPCACPTNTFSRRGVICLIGSFCRSNSDLFDADGEVPGNLQSSRKVNVYVHLHLNAGQNC